jgi:hypothetical protein
LRKIVDLATAALAADDPWEGFTTLLRSMFATVATDKGMRQAILGSRHALGAARSDKVELIRLLSLVIQRAQRDGRLRAGITARDIPAMILMVSAIADFAAIANPRIWERYCMLMIDGLSADGNPQRLIPEAMSEADMALASSSW